MSDNQQFLPKLSTEKLMELKESNYLIDTRHPENFARSHIKGSINIPLEGSFYKWAAQVVPASSQIILVVDSEETLAQTVNQLKYIDLNQVLGFILFDEALLIEKGNLELLAVRDLVIMEDVFVVDVRTMAEWNDGHIESAHHIELNEFQKRMDEIPRNKKVAITCGAGFRSSIASSILKATGHKEVASIHGGMRAWNSANLPIK